MFALTVHHLRFTALALTPILMDAFKGSALRGAWHTYLQHHFCPAPESTRNDPLHQNICPVCYLVSRSNGPETRRPFTLQPPLSRQAGYEPGETFQFGFTLLGQAHTLFPYALLAWHEVGETLGLGRFLPGGRHRGRYRLLQVEAYDPHTNRSEVVYDRTRGRTVQMPTVAVTADSIAQRVERMTPSPSLPLKGEGVREGVRLVLRFLTPLRLIEQERLMHRFRFETFVRRLLERLYGVAEQFGTPTPSPTPSPFRGRVGVGVGEEVRRLWPVIHQVRVVDDRTHWWDVKGHSQRKGGPTYLGGLVGDVVLEAPDWRPLLPYLLWGESLQVGKNVIKGCGLYRVDMDVDKSEFALPFASSNGH